MKTKTMYLVLAVVFFCTTISSLQAKPANAINPSYTDNDLVDIDNVFVNLPEQFIQIEGGCFNMGSPDNATYTEPDEFPAHQVTLSSFIMCKHEVTQREYTRVMNYNPSCFGTDNTKPVERVTWYNAIEYCNRLSIRRGFQPCYTYAGHGTNPNNWPHNWNTYFHNNITCNWDANGFRLPTEAEFQFAARGGATQDNFTYAGSNNLDDVAWYQENTSYPQTVMTKQPNQLGIYDLTGNVWEWNWDWFGNYASNAQTDPHGPDNGIYKVRTGGAWDGNSTYQRIVNRSYTYIIYGYEGMGFRVVRGVDTW